MTSLEGICAPTRADSDASGGLTFFAPRGTIIGSGLGPAKGPACGCCSICCLLAPVCWSTPQPRRRPSLPSRRWRSTCCRVVRAARTKTQPSGAAASWSAVPPARSWSTLRTGTTSTLMSRRSSRGGDPGSEPDSGEHTGTNSGGHDHLGQRPSGARPAGAQPVPLLSSMCSCGRAVRAAAVATWART